jgi:hypothetical protein
MRLYSWLNLGTLWSLQFALTYQPHMGSSAGLPMRDVERMHLQKALWWRDVALPKQRETEAEALRNARTKG